MILKVEIHKSDKKIKFIRSIYNPTERKSKLKDEN